MALRNSIFYLPSLIFGILPILTGRFYALPIVSLVLYVLFFGKKKNISFQRLKNQLPLFLLYALFCITIVYTTNTELAVKKIFETRLGLLLIPALLLCLSEFTKKQLNFFVNTYAITCTLLSFFYIYNLFTFPEPQNPAFAYPSSFYFKTVLYKMPYVGKETFEVSLLLGINVLVLSSLYSKGLRGIVKVLYALSFVLSIFLLLCAVTKSVLFLLALIFVFQFLKNNFDKRISYYATPAILLIFLATTQVSTVQWELKELIAGIQGKTTARNDSFDIRKNITASSIDLAIETNPILGNGVGSVQDKLESIYKKKQLSNLLERKYDTHNQYLGIYLETGVVGLLLILIQFFISIKHTLKERKTLLTKLLFLFCFLFLFENIIFRQHGVLLYATLVSLTQIELK